MDEERRAEQRQRTLKAGQIVFNDLTRAYDCLVRNTSSEGAMLKLSSTVGIPDEFFVYIESEKTRRPAAIIWRNENQIGVRYAGPAEAV